MNSQDDNPIYQLMKVVDELTQEHTVIVEDHEHRFLGHRQEVALLVKLRASVQSDVNGNGGDGKPARERVPIDVSAQDLYNRLDADIREWYGRETDYAEHGRPAPWVVLRQWYIRFINRYRAGDISDKTMWSIVGTVESWVQQIRDKLDPPRKIEITSACPICGKEWVNVGLKLADGADDPEDIEMVRVLVAVEREHLEDSYAVCRSCDQVWRGVTRMRQLRILIDDADTTRRTEANDTDVIHVA